MVQIPPITNWSVFPQNGDIGYFDDMNVWIGQGNTVIHSANASIVKMNEAIAKINNIAENAINAITFDNIAQLKLHSSIGRVDVLGYYTKGDGGGGTFYWDSTSTEADNGGTIIQATGITTGRWKDADTINLTIKDFGGKDDDLTDNLVFAKKMADTLGYVYFSGDNTYRIGYFATSYFNNIKFYTDKDTILSFAVGNDYSSYDGIIFMNDIKAYFRDTSSKMLMEKTPYYADDYVPSISIPLNKAYSKYIDLTDTTVARVREFDWSNTPSSFFTISEANIYRTVDFIEISGYAGRNTRGVFIELGVGETINALFDDGLTKGAIGIVVRGTLGYTFIYAIDDSSNLSIGTKLDSNSGISQDTLIWNIVGQGIYNSYAPSKSIWSVTKIANNEFELSFNGKSITYPYMNSIGDLVEVGYVCYTTTNSFTLSGFTLNKNFNAKVSRQVIQELRFFGDSTADTFPSDWVSRIKPTLYGKYGLDIRNITNYAIAGQNAEEQYALMQTVGLGDAQYITFCIGTNNVQGNQSLTSFKNTITNIINFVTSNGRKLIFIIPYMWYTKSQSGGIGQESSNYDIGAKYRMALERLALKNNCIIVDINKKLPQPDPRLLSLTNVDPLLRDNIHQTALGYKLYASAFCDAFVNDHNCYSDSFKDNSISKTLVSGTVTNSDDLVINVNKNGIVNINGIITLTTPTANGITLFKLPRWARPTKGLNFLVMGSVSGNTPTVPYVTVYTDGDVIVQNMTSTSINRLDINISFQTIF